MTTLIGAGRLAAVAAALVFGAGLWQSALAQNAVITGTVTSMTGEPLANANVFITEMGISVVANPQGAFTVTIPAARVAGQPVNLRARVFGYTPGVRPITVTAGSQRVDFRLRQDVNRLAAVVVTGVTGATEQRKLPFSVSSVDAAEMPVPASNPLQQLQGKVPGANIVQTTGRPGATPQILLRGPKSINGQGRGQQPLFIVDGVILQGGLGDINPQDIESVEVVKGAAAASLYGSRAGNGVINIRTRSGRTASEGIRFTARGEYGQQDIENEFLLAQHHFMMMDETKTRFCTAPVAGQPYCARTVNFEEEALRINELAGDVALSPVSFTQDHGIASGPGKNLQRGVFQVERWPVAYDPISQMVTNGARTNASLDATGRFGGTGFFASVNNFREAGGIRFLDGYRRSSLRLNVDQQMGTDWSFGVRSYYARSESDGANQEQGAGFFRITRNPIGTNLRRTDNQGRLFIRSNPLNQGAQNYNPLYELQAARRIDNADRFLGAAEVRYTPFTWLEFDGNFNYDRTNGALRYQEDRGFRTTTPGSRNLGYIERHSWHDQSYNTAVSAAARHTWRDIAARFTTRYLFEQQDFNLNRHWGSDLAVGGLTTSDAATTAFNIRSQEQSIRSIGVMAGVDATWKERYIVDALVRRDGSSLFGADNRWATYGRGSLAWRASQEPWWFAPQLNEFKLRGSIGTAGGRPSYVAQYETFTIGTGGTLSRNALGNRNLRPETTTEVEVGVDAEAFNRLGLQVNYANAVTKDQILPVPPASVSGFGTQWRNAGTLESKTWELSLNVPILTRRNLSWSTRVNYDRTRTVITKLDVPEFFQGTSAQATEQMFKFAEGERLGTFYGRKFVTSCRELPTAFQGQCGGAGSAFQVNSDGYVVWVGQGNTLGDGITKNLWQAVLPASQSPWNVATNWGFPMIVRDDAGSGRSLPLGNALPDYRIGVSQTLNWRRFFAYAQLDGNFGQHVYNQGRHWSLGDFMSAEADQAGKSVQDAKPIGYYWRAPSPDHGAGTGGFYDFLAPNSHTVEDASFVKLREVNLSYNIGQVRGYGDWTVGVTGRNLYTFTDYRGFDPEVGLTNPGGFFGGVGGQNYLGSSLLAAVDAFQFPNARSFTLSVTTRF